jgi:hypothetical protein
MPKAPHSKRGGENVFLESGFIDPTLVLMSSNGGAHFSPTLFSCRSQFQTHARNCASYRITNELPGERSVSIERHGRGSAQLYINCRCRRSNVTTDSAEPGVAESLPSRT